MFGLYEVQLTTDEGQVAVFHFETDNINEPDLRLHALANVGLFEVCVREYGDTVWSVIEPEETNGWELTDHKDVSFEHCDRPAQWHGEQVVCSKCSEVMPDN